MGLSELTDWARGVGFDDAAEICERLLEESALPVQQVPDGGNSSVKTDSQPGLPAHRNTSSRFIKAAH